MRYATPKDRNGPFKVAEQKENIDKTFADLSVKLFDFNKQIQNSQGAASIKTVTPADKMNLFNSFYDVANTHSSVALEFMNKLKTWAHESLVPEYKKSIEEALRTDEEDILFQAVSSNFTCFSLFVGVTSTVFYSVTNDLRGSSTAPKFATPEQILFGAFRDEFYEKIRDRVQGIFFRRLTAIRSSEDLTQLGALKPIADILSDVASRTFDERVSIYRTDYVDTYIRQMVTDNKAAVKEQMTRGVPANEIAGWINRRASFEQQLMSSLVAPENYLHRVILDRYNDEVVAECVNDSAVLSTTEGFHRDHIIQLENTEVRQLISDFHRQRPLSDEELNHQELEKLIFDRSSRDCFIKQVIPLLVENHVTKESFFLLNENDLREMGVKIGPRKQLLQIIEQETFRRNNLSARTDISSRPRSRGHTPRIIGGIPPIALSASALIQGHQQQFGNAPPLPPKDSDSNSDRSFVASSNSEFVSVNGGNEYTANSELESWKSSGNCGSTTKK